MGVATITAHRVFTFRVDPEAITFNYNLITHTESTYGGKVIQILATNVQGLSLPVMAGTGGRDYLTSVVTFFKEMMFWQRDTKNLAYFDYPPRKYHMSIYADSLQIQDALSNVAFPFTMTFKVNKNDVSGPVKSSIVDAEMKKLADGVGYTKNEFNDPSKSQSNSDATAPSGEGGQPAATAAGGTAATPANPSTTPAPAAPAAAPAPGAPTVDPATIKPGDPIPDGQTDPHNVIPGAGTAPKSASETYVPGQNGNA